MKSLEIRQKFFNYFLAHKHTRVPSSSLIPAQDPTLLFTNAGMNQFKDIFLGLEKRSYTRAVSIQKCVRAGGKHNDLDNVGFTKRHLTFFEMMGNFSFGDYFKKEAIQYAWEFLIKELNLSIDNLHATVFHSDEDSYVIWKDIINLPIEKIHRLGYEDNFWQMGDLGPCGPCSEIHIDRGPNFGCTDITSCGPACTCDRFLEIWNLVFMQFDRQTDGSLKPLVQTGVDTGMGLERLCSIVQEKDSVFQTDLFMPIINHIQELTGIDYASCAEQDKAPFHVLADHIRSASFLIADGCAPSNEGRGYVLRKIIRRAALFAQKLSERTIFPELYRFIVQYMKDIYPELQTHKELIYAVLESEVKKFSTNLTRGQHILETYFEESKKEKVITGQQAFKLYDTYGFPLELIQVIAKERGYTINTTDFEKYMTKQQEQSGKKTTDPLDHLTLDESIQTTFTGYKELETESHIIALINTENKLVTHIAAGETCWVIAQQSPFFIVGGGQVPDQGWLIIHNQTIPLESVRYINGRIAARITTPVAITTGDQVLSRVDKIRRTNAMKNHTGTHLLQAALITLFGKHIKQSGSLVHPDYLRFDFTYHKNLSPEDIKKVEQLVNQKIMENIPVHIEYLTLKQATQRGALAFFGDKYDPDNVRLVRINNFSAELCGGTHVATTGVIGSFKITEVSTPAAGHRRIVAVTGPGALALFQETYNKIKMLSQELKVTPEDIILTTLKLKDQIKSLQQKIKEYKKQLWLAHIPQWQKQITQINAIPFLYLAVSDMDNEDLRTIATHLMKKSEGFYVLTSQLDNRVIFFASISPRFQNTVNLKKFATWLKETHNLQGGGGSPVILQGGGAKIDPNLQDSIKKWLAQELQS